MNDSERQISTETALRLLAKRQRQQILRQVADAPDGTTVDQLQKHIGATGPTIPEGNASPTHRSIELHHVHLPMLQEANVIEHDVTEGTVHRGREFREILSLLEVIDGHLDDTSTAFRY